MTFISVTLKREGLIFYSNTFLEVQMKEICPAAQINMVFKSISSSVYS